MNFQPSNFYISIIDLFAILLPGAIASMVLYHFYQIPIDDFLNIGKEHTGAYSGLILLFSSYLLGHIISQVSAYLDEWVYDPLKKNVYKDHKSVNKIGDIRKNKYGNIMTPVYINSYKWSVFKLQKEQPHAAAEVERYMADSKFFRSLFVLLIVLVGVFSFPLQQNLLLAFACFLLAAFSMIRYFKKRRKSTETAYQYVIFSEELNKKTKHNVSIFRKDNNPSFKKHQSQINFLQQGFTGKAASIEIPAKETLISKTSETNKETWCCLEGRGILNFPDINEDMAMVLVPNASVSIPKNKTIRIDNTGDESLLILAH